MKDSFEGEVIERDEFLLPKSFAGSSSAMSQRYPPIHHQKGAPEGAFLLGQHAFLEDDLSGELHAARVAGEDSLLVVEAGAVDGDEAAVPG